MPTRAKTLLGEFVAVVGGDQHRPQRKFLCDALIGLQRSGDVMLSGWGRALNERTQLIHTEKRLSRHMRSKHFRDEPLRTAALELVTPLVKSECDTISIDTTDVRKFYSRAQPNMGGIHDGSTSEIGQGWMVMRADAMSRNGAHIPLASRLYSNEANEYQGELAELERCLRDIAPHVPPTMPRIFDSGFDGGNFRNLFEGLDIRYLVRLNISTTMGLRNVYCHGQYLPLLQLVQTLDKPIDFRAKKFQAKAKRSWKIRAGWTRIRFEEKSPGGAPIGPESRSYFLVVAHREGAKLPMAILTNMRIRNDDDAQRAVNRYFGRWCVEDGHRLQKVEFGLENVRALTWTGIRRMNLLVHVAHVLLAWLAHQPAALRALMRTVKAFGPVPRFCFYRLRMALGAAL